MDKRKTFSKNLYKANDKKGKESAIELFTQIFALKNIPVQKELYKAGDLKFHDCDGIEFIVEAEVKNVGWTDKGFKYKTLHFAYKPLTDSDYFVSFNGECDKAFICSKEQLIQDKNVIYKNTFNKNNGQSTKNEPFYEIKISDCEYYIKESDRWHEEN